MIQGRDLMLFLDGKSTAFALDCVLNVSVEPIEKTSKTNGRFKSFKAGMIAWDVSSSNIVADTDKGVTFYTLLRAMLDKKTFDVTFAIKAETDDTVPTGGWTPDSSTTMITGKAFITSLSETAQTDDNVTFTMTLQGTDELTL